jgi:hypothetical protein
MTLISSELSRDAEAKKEYFDALKIFADFHLSPDNEKITLIKNKLFKSLELKRENQEVYILFAYLFYLSGNNKLAMEYLSFAKQLNPENEKINELKNYIHIQEQPDENDRYSQTEDGIQLENLLDEVKVLSQNSDNIINALNKRELSLPKSIRVSSNSTFINKIQK